MLFFIPLEDLGATLQIQKLVGKTVHALKKVQTAEMFQQQSTAINAKNGHRHHLIDRISGWLVGFELKNIKLRIIIFAEWQIRTILDHGAIQLIQLRVVNAVFEFMNIFD